MIMAATVIKKCSIQQVSSEILTEFSDLLHEFNISLTEDNTKNQTPFAFSQETYELLAEIIESKITQLFI